MSTTAVQRAAKRRMTMTATVERDKQEEKDGFNHPKAPDWEEEHEALPCFVWSTRKRQQGTDNRVLVIEDLRAMVALDADVRQGDRITNVKRPDGTTFLSDTVQVQGVVPLLTHQELVLERVT